MKKNLYITSIFCGIMVLAATSCENLGEPQFEDDQFSSTLYLKDTGLTEIEFYNINQDLTFTTSIGKGGTAPEVLRTAAVRVFTQEELDTYNQENDMQYVTLPADCYTFDKQYNFEQGIEKRDLTITLKAKIGELDTDIDYVLPLKLISDTHSVNDDKRQLIIKPNIITPQVMLRNSGLQEKLSVHSKNQYLQSATFTTMVKLGMPNNGWTFTAKLESDLDALHFLVDQYSIQTGKIYKLLPASMYTLPELTFTNVENEKELEVPIQYVEGIKEGEYLLPIVLKEIEGKPFEINNTPCYVLVDVTSEGIQIKIEKSDISAISSATPIERLIDGGIGEGKFWESQYGNAEEGKTYTDPTYGIYIDIVNFNQRITQQMTIKLSAYAAHTRPTSLAIYAKKAGNDEWVQIQEPVTPFPNAKEQSQYLLKLDGNHIKEFTFNDCGEITAIRIALLKSKNYGDLTKTVNTGESIPLVGLGEVEIFGY